MIGIRPPASPSCRLYEPEAVGAIRAYAPEGMRDLKLDVIADLGGTLRLSRPMEIFMNGKEYKLKPSLFKV